MHLNKFTYASDTSLNIPYNMHIGHTPMYDILKLTNLSHTSHAFHPLVPSEP